MNSTPDNLHLDPVLLAAARQELAEEGIEETPSEYEAGLREWLADVQQELAEEDIHLTLDEILKAAAVFNDLFGKGLYPAPRPCDDT